MRFEGKLVVFTNFKVNPEEVSHIYVDRKTKTVEPGNRYHQQAFIVAGLLAKIVISDKIGINGKSW